MPELRLDRLLCSRYRMVVSRMWLRRITVTAAAILVGGYAGLVLAVHYYDEGEADGRALHLTRG